MRTSIENSRLFGNVVEIKHALKLGGLTIVNQRQVGKSTAVLELCKELGVEDCVVVYPNHSHKNSGMALWHKIYSQDIPPHMCAHYGLERYLVGRKHLKAILCDEWFSFELAEVLYTATDIFAGVMGTRVPVRVLKLSLR